MGCWGTGLYSNDLARDLKDDFKELARIPFEADVLVEQISGLYPASDDPANEDYCNFWLVLADLLHAYGISHPATQDCALRVIETGTDIEMNRALEMSESDLAKRAAVLEALRERLSTATARPRDRKLFKAPPTLLMAQGDVWAYPTDRDNPICCWHDARKPDAWNAFVVVATACRFGYYPHYFVIRLHVFTRHRPTLEDCRQAPLGWTEGPNIAFDEQGNQLPGFVTIRQKSGGWTECDRKSLKKLYAERLGELPIDSDRLRPVYNAPDSRLGQIYSPDLEPRRRYGGIVSKLFAFNFRGIPEYRPVPADETLADYLLS